MNRFHYISLLVIFLVFGILFYTLLHGAGITGKVASGSPRDSTRGNGLADELIVPDSHQEKEISIQNMTPNDEEAALMFSNSSANQVIRVSDSPSASQSGPGSNSNSLRGRGRIQPIQKASKNITIISPRSSRITLGTLNITYWINGNASECRLYVDDNLTLVDDYILRPDRFDTDLVNGLHTWQISCLFGNQTLYTRKMKLFATNLTYLENIDDFEDIKNFRIHKDFGNIRFRDPVNLSSALDFDKHVNIRYNYIELDSKNLPQLDKPATLTLEGLNFQNPVIFRDGEYCSDCNILQSSDNLTFSVEHFSAYYATENSRLFIYDSSDMQTKYANELIAFYANFTNVTGVQITGACNINFTDTGLQSMVYNPSLKMYEYNRSFSQADVFYYDVGCSGSGYTSIGLRDYASINLRNHPNGVNLTSYGSQRGNVSKVYNQTTMAGNTTVLDLASLTITNYWQGFYGNISGGISLQDSQGNTFYDWNVVALSGEVFATRAYDVNFASFNCSNSTHIGSEETYLGHASSTGDSVSNTFSGSTHPGFSVGSLTIPQDSCISTNLYVNEAQGSDFYEVLLSDDASNIVYTAIIDENTVGFDGRTYDFQMLVGDNGDSSVTSYYFFMELG